MADQRANWADVLDPVFRKIYGDEVRDIPTIASTVFNVMTSVSKTSKIVLHLV